MLALAEAADQSNLPDGLDMPAKIQLREHRLGAIEAARAKIEARTRERFEREQAELAEREATIRRPPVRSLGAGRRSPRRPVHTRRIPST